MQITTPTPDGNLVTGYPINFVSQIYNKIYL